MIKGEIKGFFKNIIEFNIDNVRGTHVEENLLKEKGAFQDDLVSVMRNGKKTEVKINKEKNECQVQMIEFILNKNKCKDVFMDFKKVLQEDSDDEEELRDNKLMVKKKFGENMRKQTLIKL